MPAHSVDRTIVVVDFLVTYPFAFLVNAIPDGSTGPAAPWTYWLTQAWVYALIAPVAAVAAWRGLRQFQRMQRGADRWWRLTAEAAVAGAVPVIASAVFEQAKVFRAIGEAAVFAGALGLTVTGMNLLLGRWLFRGDSAHIRI